MFTVQELDKIWENQIQPQIQFLSNNHEKELSKLVVIHIILYAMSSITYHLLILPSLSVEPDFGFGLALSLIPNFIYVLYETRVKSEQIKKIKSFYNLFLNPIGIIHTTEKSEFVDCVNISATKIFDCDFGYFDDIFTGKFNNIPYQIIETTLKKSLSSKTSIEVFSGVTIVINDFLEIDKNVTYEDKKFEKSKVTPEQDFEITKFISMLRSNIPGYKGIMFAEKKIFIFCESEGNLFEVPTVNVTKNDFVGMLLEINKFISYLENLNLNEYYKFPQESLNKNMQNDTSLTPMGLLGLFVLYFILTGAGAFVVFGLILFCLANIQLITFEIMFQLGTILPVITGILFACHLIKQDLDAKNKKENHER